MGEKGNNIGESMCDSISKYFGDYKLPIVEGRIFNSFLIEGISSD